MVVHKLQGVEIEINGPLFSLHAYSWLNSTSILILELLKEPGGCL